MWRQRFLASTAAAHCRRDLPPKNTPRRGRGAACCQGGALSVLGGLAASYGSNLLGGVMVTVMLYAVVLTVLAS